MAKQLRKLSLTTTKDYGVGDTRQIPCTATVDVYRQGSVVSIAKTVSIGTTAQDIKVRDAGRIEVGDTLRKWGAIGAGTPTVTCVVLTKVLDGQGDCTVQVDHASGGDLVLVEDDRLIVINAKPTLYDERSGSSTKANPFSTDGTTGYGEAWVAERFVDVVVSGSGLTTQLFVDEEGGEAGQVINVQDYPTPQDAIDAAHDGQTVYFPAGQYAIAAALSITKKVRITGDQQQSTILAGTTLNQHVIAVVSCYGVIIENMTIQNNAAGTGTGCGIFADEAHLLTLHNLFIYNTQLNGIHLAACNFPLISSCNIYGCKGAGIFGDGYSNMGAQYRIFHTVVEECNWWGIYIDEASGVQIDAIAAEHNCLDLSGAPNVGGTSASSDYNGPQVYIYGAIGVHIGRMDIEDFDIGTPLTALFLREVSGAFIGGTTFVNLGGAAGTGLRLDACEGVAVVGNNFYHNVTGIHLQGAGDTPAGTISKNVTIAGNAYDTVTTNVSFGYTAETELDAKNIVGEWEQGWMLPRFDSAALPTPVIDGALVYTTDTDKIKIRAAGGWTDLN